MPLVQHYIVALIDSGAIHANLAQGADDHLGIGVSGEIVAWAGDAPIEIALVVEYRASSRAAAHEIYSANGWRFCLYVVCAVLCSVENAEIDFCPRVLVAADDHTWPIHVKEQNGTVWRRLAENVVLNGEIQVRVVAAGRVALQLVGRVRELVGKGREPPLAADPGAWRSTMYGTYVSRAE